MKDRIKINFADFWAGFKKDDNYFFKLLSKRYDVIISDQPDFLVYSCYGDSYLEYSCIRIFYTAENIRPDFDACDFAISFDFIERENHYRLPLYAIYIDNFYNSPGRKISDLLSTPSAEIMRAEWKKKKKFCCMVVSNSHSRKRIDFFNKLSKVRQVDSGGRILNNVGGPVTDKLAFIKDYKFVIAFENSSYPGYVTEKVIEPVFMNCIPVYWGNPEVQKDLNTKRFLNYKDFHSADAMIERMIEIDKNDELAVEMLLQPVFPDNRAPEYLNDDHIIDFFTKIIECKGSAVPVATVPARIKRHAIKRKLISINNLIASKTGRQFR